MPSSGSSSWNRGWGHEADFPEDAGVTQDVDDTDGSTPTKTELNKTEMKKGPGGWGGGHGARGVRCPSAAAQPLLHAAHRLRTALDTRVRPTLRRWLATAVRDGAQKSACSLHAHLAYLHWSTPPSALTMRGAQTLLTAQAYILVNHVFSDSTSGSGAKLRASDSTSSGDSTSVASHDESLGFAPTEIFDLFQRQRANILRWMDTNPERADSVLEEVVRVLTLNSAGLDDFHLDDDFKKNETVKKSRLKKFKETFAGLKGKLKTTEEAEPDTETEAISEAAEAPSTIFSKSTLDGRHVDRRWVRVPGPGGVGRFIPETEAAAAATAAGCAVREAKRFRSDWRGKHVRGRRVRVTW